MHCKECGLEIPENSRYCPNCGVDQLDEEKNISKNSKTVGEAKKVFVESVMDPVKDTGSRMLRMVVKEVADAIEEKTEEELHKKLKKAGLEKDNSIPGKVKRILKRT